MVARCVGIDPGTHVGLACVDIENPQDITGRCIHFPKLTGWPRLQAIAHQVRQSIEIWQPSVVMVEGYIIRHRSSAVAIISCGTVVRQVLFDLHLHWTEVEPMTLKKWTTGNGGAKKEQMALAIKERFGYSHASDDVIDAVALAQLGVHLGVIGADPTVKGLTPGW